MQPPGLLGGFVRLGAKLIMIHETDVDDNGAFELMVRAQRENAEEVRKLLNRAASQASARMFAKAPRSKATEPPEDGANTIAQSIGWEPAVYGAGGSGGGGTFSARAGAINNPPDHLIYLLVGTGLYVEPDNEFGAVPGLIIPKTAKFMSWFNPQAKYGAGMQMFVRETEGIKPNNFWVREAQTEANQTIRDGLIQIFSLR